MIFAVAFSDDRRAQLKTLIERLYRSGVARRDRDRVVVIEQVNKPFNLGAVRNLGIILSGALNDDVVCFTDVDIVPDNEVHAYPVPPHRGVVTHVYGHEHSLGGIFCMYAGDLRRVGGFISNKRWGDEDVVIMRQCRNNNIVIDKSRMVKRFRPGFLEIDMTGRPETREQSLIEFKKSLLHKMSQRDLSAFRRKGALSTMQYTVIEIQDKKDYCLFRVRID